MSSPISPRRDIAARTEALIAAQLEEVERRKHVTEPPKAEPRPAFGKRCENYRPERRAFARRAADHGVHPLRRVPLDLSIALPPPRWRIAIERTFGFMSEALTPMLIGACAATAIYLRYH